MRTPRRRARELALQGLYQWQLTGAPAVEIARDLAELEGYGAADEAFLKAELAGVIGEAAELQARLEPLADRKWAEVSPVEKAILLIGAWEIASVPEMPYRVSINEAIELAKRFGGTDGHKYVNGILDRVAAALRPDEVAAGRTAERKPRQASAGRAKASSSPKKAEA
jgi:transcription antitermination protein NusB